MAGPGLVERLRAGETIVSGWSTLPEPLVAELLARSAYDAVSLDVQHGLHTEDSTMRSIGAVVMAGKPVVVRLPVAAFALASRVLDFGADGVIAPMINTAEDAKAMVAATKYPPVGERSWGPVRSMALHAVPDNATQLASANAVTMALAMVETNRSMANLDDILSVPGLDGVFVGPSDLSVTISDGAKITPTEAWLDDALIHIADKSNAAQKITGIFAVNAARARHFIGLGYRFIVLASDQIHLADGVRAMLSTLDDLRKPKPTA